MTSLLLLALTVSTLSWDAVIEEIDGDPLPRCVDVDPATPTDRCLDHYNVFHGMEVEISEGIMGYELEHLAAVDETELGFETQETVAGKWFYAVTAVTREGLESEESNHVFKIIGDDAPLPPGGVAIVDDLVYIIVQSNDTLVLLPIGTINTNTTCEPDVAIRDDNGVLAYKVPVSSVTPYSAGQEMVVVFSPCTN